MPPGPSEAPPSLRRPRRFTWERELRWVLTLGVVAPLLYFGVQLIVGLSTPGYSFLDSPASDLGAAGQPHALLFNAGAIATGIAVAAAALGIACSTNVIATSWAARLAVVLSVAAVASAAIGAVAAGVFPLPDERHGFAPYSAGTFAVPFILPLVFWRTGAVARKVFLGNIALFVAAGSILASIGNEASDFDGLAQRLLAASVFPLIGFASWLTRDARAAHTGL